MKYKYYAKRNIIPYKRRKKYRAHGNRAHRTPLNSQIETHIVKRCKHSAWATPALRPSGRGGALALNPQTGESSSASLGVPSEALLHRHNAAVHIGTLGTALRRGRVRETAQEKRP
jgi:hypothetical protein